VPIVIESVENRVGSITLNLPEKRNALGPEMVSELKSSVRKFLVDDEVKIIVFRAEGTAFCSGADLEYLSKIRNFSREENLNDSKNLQELFDLIHSGNKVFISEVHGPAMAGGCGLATICDFCFASEDASFGYTEARIGFVPALVMVYLQERISGKDLREMLLTAKIYSAEEANNIGLVNGLFLAGELRTATQEFAENLARSVSTSSLAYIKKMLRNMRNLPLDEALNMAAGMNAEARMSADCIRGIDAFLNKEKITW
jgi:methylglutaconyl-CoA hydratase